jgi:hypothetical protein
MGAYRVLDDSASRGTRSAVSESVVDEVSYAYYRDAYMILIHLYSP